MGETKRWSVEGQSVDQIKEATDKVAEYRKTLEGMQATMDAVAESFNSVNGG